MIFLNNFKIYIIFFLFFSFNDSSLKVNKNNIKKNKYNRSRNKNNRLKNKKKNIRVNKNINNRVNKYKKIIRVINNSSSNNFKKKLNRKVNKKTFTNKLIKTYLNKSNKDNLEEIEEEVIIPEGISADEEFLDFVTIDYEENNFNENLKYFEDFLKKIENYKKFNKLDDLLEKDLNIILESISYYMQKINEFNLIINDSSFDFKDLKFEDKENFFNFIVDSLNNFIAFYNDLERNDKIVDQIKKLNENKSLIEKLILKIKNDEDIEYEKYKNSFIFLRNIFFHEFIILIDNDLKFNDKFKFLIEYKN